MYITVIIGNTKRVAPRKSNQRLTIHLVEALWLCQHTEGKEANKNNLCYNTVGGGMHIDFP